MGAGTGAGVSREIDGLPVAEFAFPGELRDSLVAAVLRGEKTSTSTLLIDYERDEEPLPEVGQQYVVVDSEERPVAVIETTELRVLALGEVDLAFARDEGEGFETVAQWREAHERFWASYLPDVEVDDASLVVAERFRLIERR
jgi:uncharacterized protein YhfF